MTNNAWFNPTTPASHDDNNRPTEQLNLNHPKPGPPQQSPTAPPPDVQQRRQPAQHQGHNQGWAPAPMGGVESKTELLHVPPQPSLLAWLVIVEGPRTGTTHQLAGADTTVGRDASQADIVLDDTSISRQHIKIRLQKNDADGETFFIYDLATSNGTRLNGAAIVKEPLKDNDRIEIGRTKLVFKCVE